MLVPKKNRQAIYTQLFKDGVMTAKKDLFLKKHHHLDVPNLHVVKLLQSLCSREYVSEKFSWQWHYWTLTDEGIVYLREYLHLGEDVAPNTHTTSTGHEEIRADERSGEDHRGRGDRDNYRSARY